MPRGYVGRAAALGDAGRPGASQHLAILRQRRVVLTRREGVTIYYRIANLKILRAFDIMREVLFEQLAEGRRLVKTAGAGARRRGTGR